MPLGSKTTSHNTPPPHISRYNSTRTVTTIHVPTRPTKASQTAELKLPKFQISSTPPQVTNPAQLTTYRPQQSQSLF